MLIDGKKIAKEILDNLRAKVRGRAVKPGLAVVLVGKNPASVLYTGMKTETCSEIGFYSEKHELSEDTSEERLLELVGSLNRDDRIHGILVQLPLPKHIDEKKVMLAIDPEKDADGFHPMNLGKLVIGEPGLVSCTPLGCMKLIDSTGVSLEGKEAVVVGASVIVGKPLMYLLLNREMTVTICHIKTRDLASHTRRADVLIAAAGSPGLIKKDMVKRGAVVIDVGTTMVNKKATGDVDYEVRDIAGFVTPVPGGVGPMTIACLMENTYKAYESLLAD